ncbi:type IV pilin protein [Herminiimonas sp. NPDC097707]|uniref:type IV pilin protein n=1 Tax=Herminiimonas sp. NPDC097707 TaxID=3364007 RepID=UPI003839DDEE
MKHIFSSSSNSRQSAGFTLIELMITVAIIGILASIALPYYGDYVRRGKVQEATSELANMRVKMEQYYQDNRSYAGYVDAACATAAGAVVSGKYFTFACATDAATPNVYTITATGVASQGMDGYKYSLDQNNTKKSTVPPGAEVNCWLTKRGDAC